ncbi:cutinase transcription factor 1 beta [Echria macrotheca]|uniref:Cutinase transcription factor 1 beta n=1 Tax=Echria macrotheca TaxID=438768 RepID=A0AAJ0B4G6_9PEZI|nr:cutinase transcription factor 1 beta [Echria macrotheca]
MADSRKRSWDSVVDDSFDDNMARVKAAPDAAIMAAFADMPREKQVVLEQAAEILNMPLITLLRQQEQSIMAAANQVSPDTSSSTVQEISDEPEQQPETQEPRDPSPPRASPGPVRSPAEGNISATPGTQFAGYPYNYDDSIPWTSSDASQYRNNERVTYMNHLNHGFVPDDRISVPSFGVERAVPPGSSQFTMSTGSGNETMSVSDTDLATTAMTALLHSPAQTSSGGTVVEVDRQSNVGGYSNTPAVSSSEAQWTLVDMTPDQESSASAVYEENTGKELMPVTFVPVNPMQPSGSGRQKRGPFQNDQLREETNKTRQLKACLRCRMQKTRCSIDENDPSGACVTCQNVGAFQKIHHLPCLRYRLTECTEFRVGKARGMEYSARWPVMKLKDISKWASSEVRTITVLSDVSPVPFDLQVRRFVPIPQDSLHRAWMDGKTKKFIETTPYAIHDMKSAMASMRRYITQNTFNCMDHFLKGSDELVRMTFNYAREYMSSEIESEEEAKLLANYMKLWVAVRRTATLEHIISDDTLDMEPEMEDRSYPLLGKVPLPPVMIQQLDIILTVGVLLPLQKQVLEDLQKLVLSNNPRTWMTMYLITFMSLYSCASLTGENYRNARRQGFRRRYSFPSFVQERQNSANVFLSHYHYRTEGCNPFKMDWKRRHATPFADMSTYDVIFLQKTQKLLEEKSRAESIRMARENELYENELYFISQMYEENWQPRDARIDFDGGTIHGGPVKKYYTEPTDEVAT